jgi:hypothetical protein
MHKESCNAKHDMKENEGTYLQCNWGSPNTMLSTVDFISLPCYFDIYVCSLFFLHGSPGATNIVFIRDVPETLAHQGSLGGCMVN